MRLVVVTLVAVLVTEIVTGLEAIAATTVWLCGWLEEEVGDSPGMVIGPT